jgi:hypothetical protein
MACYHAPREWDDWSNWLAAGMHGRSRWRSPVLMIGLLFAGGRRVVASWIRTAGFSDDYQDYYFLLRSVGQLWQELGRRVLVMVRRRVRKDQERVLVAIDDSPTNRYGPKVSEAGIFHDPTPGVAGQARRRRRPGNRHGVERVPEPRLRLHEAQAEPTVHFRRPESVRPPADARAGFPVFRHRPALVIRSRWQAAGADPIIRRANDECLMTNPGRSTHHETTIGDAQLRAI